MRNSPMPQKFRFQKLRKRRMLMATTARQLNAAQSSPQPRSLQRSTMRRQRAGGNRQRQMGERRRWRSAWSAFARKRRKSKGKTLCLHLVLARRLSARSSSRRQQMQATRLHPSAPHLVCWHGHRRHYPGRLRQCTRQALRWVEAPCGLEAPLPSPQFRRFTTSRKNLGGACAMRGRDRGDRVPEGSERAAEPTEFCTCAQLSLNSAARTKWCSDSLDCTHTRGASRRLHSTCQTLT